MKQVLQNLKTGVIEVADVACPRLRPRHLLIRTRRALISAGTERAFVEFGRANLFNKARSQPEQVRKVLTKMKTDGVIPTLEAVFDRLDTPVPLGGCSSGVVLEVGEGVTGFKPGDRVASNGLAAEIVAIPMNLCAKVPDGVSDDAAAFTVIASIGLQGIRLMNPTLGESVAVYGLGLIGLLAVQMLRANGCRVLGIDMEPKRLAIARSFGAEVVDLAAGADPIASAEALTQGRGIDGVLITASSKSNEIVHNAAQMSRKGGRIVLVGVVGLGLRRDDFYKKELSFQVSCSYGPGRYDPSYEDQSNDYPIAHVRWTEQRNMEAVLGLLESGALNVEPVISRRFDHLDGPAAYEALEADRDLIGILLEYPQGQVDRSTTVTTSLTGKTTAAAGSVLAGVIGAGALAKDTLLPSLKTIGVPIESIASAGGISGQHLARRFGIRHSTTDYRTIIDNPAVTAVFITTRHDTHSRMVADALDAGKHVFTEKPLALNLEQLREVKDAYARSQGLQLMVGYNRRFAPLVRRMRELLAGRSQPLSMAMMVNAGALPADHWALDPVQGGGRIIGEGCHWIDLLVYLTGSPVESVTARMIGVPPASGAQEDDMSLTLSFTDGSIGTLHYFPTGNRNHIKERLEVYGEGRVLVLDNFKTLRGFGFKGFRKKSLRRLDKGHHQEFAEFADRLKTGGPPLIPFDQLVNVTLTSFAAVDSARSGQAIRIDPSLLEQPPSRAPQPQEHAVG